MDGTTTMQGTEQEVQNTATETQGQQTAESTPEKVSTLQKFIDGLFEMRREILRTEKRKGMLQEAHKQIVECLLKRDVVNGQKALMKHFEMIDNIIHKEL